MAAERPESQEIRTGALVLVAVVVLFVGMTSIPSMLGPQMRPVSVQFPFEGGVAGVISGTPILRGGMDVGKVKSVTFVASVDDHPPYFRADCLFISQVIIPRTATVTVQQSAIGAGPKLIIQLPVASGTLHLGDQTAEEMLQVTPSQSSLALLFGPDRAAALVKSYDSLTNFNLGSPIHDLSDRVKTTSNDAGAIKAEFNRDWDAWKAQATSIEDGFDIARARGNEMWALVAPGGVLDREKLGPAFDRIKANLSTSVELINTLRTRWNDQILPPLTDLIDRFKKDCATIESDYALTMAALYDAKGVWASSKADLQIAGGQVTRAMRETVTMPWTLLGGTFEDKGEEAQFQKLAREVVRSTAELNMAVGIAKEFLAQDPKLAVRYPELVELLDKWMTQAAADQKIAAQRILDRLIGPAKP